MNNEPIANKLATPRHVEVMWETYVGVEFKGLILPDHVMERIKKAFILGFHTSHIFTKKILQLPDQQALQLIGEIESELKEHITRLSRADEFKKIQDQVWGKNVS